MTKECLMHSVAIHDPNGTLVEVLYHSDPIFPLKCASKGHKYRMLNGTILDTGLYDITPHEESNTSGTGNKHYIAKPKLPPPPCPDKHFATHWCGNVSKEQCDNSHYYEAASLRIPWNSLCEWVGGSCTANYNKRCSTENK